MTSSGRDRYENARTGVLVCFMHLEPKFVLKRQGIVFSENASIKRALLNVTVKP